MNESSDGWLFLRPPLPTPSECYMLSFNLLSIYMFNFENRLFMNQHRYKYFIYSRWSIILTEPSRKSEIMHHGLGRISIYVVAIFSKVSEISSSTRLCVTL